MLEHGQDGGKKQHSERSCKQAESSAPRHQIMTPELANRLMQRTVRGMMW